jgi:hypothetical protein
MFKKILVLIAGLSALISIAFGCMELNFNDADICVDIDHISSDTFKLNTEIDNNTSSSLAVICHILLPNWDNQNLSTNWCQGEFEYNSNKSEKIKLYVLVNNEYKTLEKYYDFGNYERADNSNSSSSSSDLEEFKMTFSNTKPNINQSITLSLEALDEDGDKITDYDWDPEITAQYRTSSSSSRRTASSTYFYVSDSTPNFDDGEATITVKFKYNYEYRVYLTDDDADVETYKQVSVWSSSSSSNGDLESFDISLSDSTPSVNQSITLTIEALDEDDDIIDDYDGDPEITAQYRTSSSSSRRTASSTYFYVSDSTPNFDDGEATITVKFKYNYEYRVYLTDDDADVETYKQVSVWSSSSSSNGDLESFDISLSDSTPSVNQSITLTIEALDEDDDIIDDYDGDPEITAQYRTSSSSSRRTASSTYFYVSDSTPNFDDGEATITVKFKYNYEYRVYLTDDDADVETYKQVSVWSSSSSSNSLETFKLKASSTKAKINERIDLTITALNKDGKTHEEYEWKVRFLVEKKSWTYRNNSSTSNYSLDESSYEFEENDEGEIKLNDLIKFKTEGSYRLKVYDNSNTNRYKYIEFNIWKNEESNSDIEGFTNKEYDQLYSIYKLWPNMISTLKKDYRKLSYSSKRKNISDEFYNNMKDVINNKSSKEFETYDDFFDAFLDRYQVTTETR